MALDLPAADDEVHALLTHFGFAIPMGHLDQGIAAHARGDWAAANAQFRPFIESLFDEMAERLAGGGALPAARSSSAPVARATESTILSPRFERVDGNGTGFLEGFYRRLHPQGAHPGLSDEDDSTFRLHPRAACRSAPAAAAPTENSINRKYPCPSSPIRLQPSNFFPIIRRGARLQSYGPEVYFRRLYWPTYRTAGTRL